MIRYVSRFFQKMGLAGKGCPKVASVARQKRNQLRKLTQIQIEKKSIKTNYRNPNKKSTKILSANPHSTEISWDNFKNPNIDKNQLNKNKKIRIEKNSIDHI